MTSHAATLRATYKTGRTRPLAWRRNQLEQMIKMLEEKMRQDVHETREKGYIVVNYDQKIDEIKRRDVTGIIE